MAINDPTPYVPTPTGALAGVALFPWDGSAWQPVGRAQPSVPTPTGVLRGVASFSWSGSAWTPAGRATPDVATPSGVLEGVALFTWNGSAWAPVGGAAPSVPTPSGSLRGIAGFNWDGSAWQPASQVACDVPTPYGVLEGCALFNWQGGAWSAVAPAPLDISFLTALDGRITFTRASVATYTDATGTLQTAAINAPRFDYNPVTHVARGLLMEEQRANVYFPSGDTSGMSTNTSPNNTLFTANAAVAPDGNTTAAKHTPSTGNGSHTAFKTFAGATSTQYVHSVFLKAAGYTYAQLGLSNTGFPAQGTANFDLVNNVVVATGAGLTASGIIPYPNGWVRCWVSVLSQASAGTYVATINALNGPTGVTFAGDGVSGIYAWGVQVEAGPLPTSYIATTASAVTRQADVASMPTGAWYAAGPGTLQSEHSYNSLNAAAPFGSVLSLVGAAPGTDFITSDQSAGSPSAPQEVGGIIFAGNVQQNNNSGGPNGAITYGAITKTAASWGNVGSFLQAAVNGVASPASPQAIAALPTVTTLQFDGTVHFQAPSCVYIRRARYWSRQLSGSELASVTA